MGHLKLRRLIKNETTWIDHDAESHKHNFIVHCILEEKSSDGNMQYYDIMKCDKCKSFKSIPKSGNIQGLILGSLNQEQKKLLRLTCTKKHKYLIGFKDLEDVIEVD